MGRSKDGSVAHPLFRRILVPVDFARGSQTAVQTAVGLLGGAEGEIHLLHVIETIDHIGFWSLRPFYRELRKAAVARMAPMVAKLSRGGVNAAWEILRGHRVEVILEYAVEKRADLIVLGSHRVERGSTPSGWSTVSYRVAIFAPCPVLLVK
jgi:nucleotide-binding universal stress UspA family protein